MVQGNPGQKQCVNGRLREGPAPALIQSANRLEVSYAPELYAGLHLADMAHTIVLMEGEILPSASGRRLLNVLLEVEAIPLEQFPLDPARGDLYMNREHYIRQIDPEVGGWLRAGRARREATNVAYTLAVRRRLLALFAEVSGLVETIIARAQEHHNTLVCDYTYLQQAQPTTLAHYLLGFVYPLQRDLERLQACFERVNRCPAGIGSVNGSRLPIDRQRLAELLGFDGPLHHTRDAMWPADLPIETAAAAVTLVVNLDRLAEDLQVWASQEFGLVELADAYTRTSVIMPQKKNPYSLAYVRGLASMAIGCLTAITGTQRTLTGQPDSRIFVYGEIPRLLDRAREAVALMSGVMDTLTFRVESMADGLGLGYPQATDLAEMIMLSAGLPYHSAHQVVGKLIATAIRRGLRADEITVELIDEAGQETVGRGLNLSPDLLRQALDPAAIVATRTGLGGAASEPVRLMIMETGDWLAEAKKWCSEAEQEASAAEAALVDLAGTLAAKGLPVGAIKE